MSSNEVVKEKKIECGMLYTKSRTRHGFAFYCYPFCSVHFKEGIDSRTSLSETNRKQTCGLKVTYRYMFIVQKAEGFVGY